MTERRALVKMQFFRALNIKKENTDKYVCLWVRKNNTFIWELCVYVCVCYKQKILFK